MNVAAPPAGKAPFRAAVFRFFICTEGREETGAFPDAWGYAAAGTYRSDE